MLEDADDVQLRIPLDKPTPARIYDYFLGGKDHFAVDRAAAEAIRAQLGDQPELVAWENRRFLWRVVEYLSRECGITQFIDVGAGLPTMRNTHEIAQAENPDVRVVYVDNDPIVLTHGRALLSTNGATSVVTADARDPASILDAPEMAALIDFSRPVALLFIAIFHFVTTADHWLHVPGNADPAAILATFNKRVVPGSYLAISHFTKDGPSPEEVAVVEDIYSRASSPMIFRPRGYVEALFDGWRLVEPGIVRPWQWHSTEDEAPRTKFQWGGVAIKED